MPDDLPRGFTVTEVARLFRVSPDKIRNWIRTGRLGAVNTSQSRSGKPRFVVLPHHLAEFERGSSAAPPCKVKRRKRTPIVDYFPD